MNAPTSMPTQAVLLLDHTPPLPDAIRDAISLPLAPVLNKPLLHHMLESLQRAGIKSVLIGVHERPYEIRIECGSGQRWGLHVDVVPLETRWSALGALRHLRRRLHPRFLVLLGPCLVEPGDPTSTAPRGLAMLRHTSPEQGAVFWLGEKAPYPVCRLDRRLIEAATTAATRATSHDAAINALYVCFPAPVSQALPGHCHPITDMGSLFTAHRVALAPPEGTLNYLLQDGVAFRPGVMVGRQAEIHPSATLTPPVAIGPGCRIGAGATVGPYAALGQGCVVDEQAEVHETLVFPNTYIGSGTSLAQAVVREQLVVRQPSQDAIFFDDPILLGSAWSRLPWDGAGFFIQRLLAAMCCLPLLPLLVLGVWRRWIMPHRMYGETIATDMAGGLTPRPLTLHHFSGGPLWWQLLPALLDVTAGKIALAGLEILSAEDASRLSKEQLQERRHAKAGLVPPWAAMPFDAAAAVALEFEEKRVMESVYLRTRSPRGDILLFVKAIWCFIQGR